jgi:MoaA/NifB/PqqE/SkfB family radical SAM enzyme
MQDVGVSVLALSGGEPLHAFERTLAVLDAADKTRSDVHLFTSGAGASRERIDRLVQSGLAAAAVGLDDYESARHDRFRAHAGAFAAAVDAIRLFVDSGILVYVNACLSRGLVADGGLHRLHDLVDGLGVAALQLLEPKPCGAYAAGVESLFGAAERKEARAFFDAAHSRRRAARPAVYYPAFIESAENLGCMMAGLSHLYVDSLGNVQPCVFLPVSFGNIGHEPFAAILARLREAVPRPLHRPCPAVELSASVGFRPRAASPLPVPLGTAREALRRLSG